MKKLSITLIIIILLVSCISAPEILNTSDKWDLDTIRKVKINLDEYDGNQPSIGIFINEKGYTIYAGSNIHRGSLDINGKNIKFSPAQSSTKMFVKDDKAFSIIDLLLMVDTYKLKNQKLYLYTGREEILTFKISSNK